MEFSLRLEILLKAAAEIGLRVQYVPVSGDGGGLCTIKGERKLFVDSLADTRTRYERTLSSLAELPEMEDVYLPPTVREDLDRERRPA